MREPYARRRGSAHLPAVGVVHAQRHALRVQDGQQQESSDIVRDDCKQYAVLNFSIKRLVLHVVRLMTVK